MPADGALVLGMNAYTAENTGTTAAPVWAEITNIRDETINMETALSDVTTRAANGWRLQVATLSEATIDTQMVYKANDPEFNSIRDSFLNRGMILMGFFDDDPALAAADNTVSGLIGGFGVTNFSGNRALEEAIMNDVTFTAREDDEGNGPQYVDLTTPPT